VATSTLASRRYTLLHHLPGDREQRIFQSALRVAIRDQGQLCGDGVDHRPCPPPKLGMERHPRHALNRAINGFVDIFGDTLFQRGIADARDRFPQSQLLKQHDSHSFADSLAGEASIKLWSRSHTRCW
jgi:hypothetical protein